MSRRFRWAVADVELDDEKAMAAQRAKTLYAVGRSEHKGLLVSLFVDRYAAKELAIEDGVPAADMHITLCYLDDVAVLGDIKIARALLTVAEIAKQTPVLYGNVSGLGRFAASEHSDGQDVVYAKPRVTGLTQLREKLAAELTNHGMPPKDHFGRWIPHITLAYVNPGVEAEQPMNFPKLHFENISVSVGRHRADVPLIANEEKGYSPDQPRDDHGRWGDGSGVNARPGRGTLSERMSAIEEAQEAVDERSMHIDADEDDPRTIQLQREYNALEAIRIVLANQEKADTNVALAATSQFRYALDKSKPGGIAAAAQSRINGDEIELMWVGSLQKGAGTKLIKNLMSYGKKHGATTGMVGLAKWGSFPYYEKTFGAEKSGSHDPITDSQGFWIPFEKGKR